MNTFKEIEKIIEERNNLIKKEQDKIEKATQVIKESEKRIQEILSKMGELKYNWEIQLHKDIRISCPMGYVEVYETKWKKFKIVDWYITLKWYELWPWGRRKIETNFYFEKLLKYWQLI